MLDIKTYFAMAVYALGGVTVSYAKESPRTLFEMVGVKQPKVSWTDSVLVIIDAQKEYETGVLALPTIRPTVSVISRLLEKARILNVPIIHVVHEGQKGLFDPADEGFKSIAELEPQEGETVIRKHLPNAFAGTDLHKILGQVGKDKKLLITGFMTHMCIAATAMAALDLGYETFVVSDAVATRALKGENGKIISAKDANQASLAALKDRISWIVKSRELLGKAK